VACFLGSYRRNRRQPQHLTGGATTMEILDGGAWPDWPPGSASAQKISESKIIVAWRKGLRKIWKLPYDCSTGLV